MEEIQAPADLAQARALTTRGRTLTLTGFDADCASVAFSSSDGGKTWSKADLPSPAPWYLAERVDVTGMQEEAQASAEAEMRAAVSKDPEATAVSGVEIPAVCQPLSVTTAKSGETVVCDDRATILHVKGDDSRIVPSTAGVTGATSWRDDRQVFAAIDAACRGLVVYSSDDPLVQEPLTTCVDPNRAATGITVADGKLVLQLGNALMVADDPAGEWTELSG